MQKVVETSLASDLATSGTITLSYPTGTTRGDFLNGTSHYAIIGQDRFDEPDGVSFAFNATNIVITYRGASTKPQGASVFVNLDMPGGADPQGDVDEQALPANVELATIVTMDLGSPDTADADGIAESQSVGAGADADLDGALVDSDGVAQFDVPRNVVAAWTGTAVLTVTGTDKNGDTLVESSASGTSLAGKKAFKTITQATFSAAVTAATIGSGDVLGLPSFLPATGRILKELQDDAAATAGTAVAGLATGTVSTATTADVRGTYDPNAACDGSKAFKLIAALDDPFFQGNPQYDG